MLLLPQQQSFLNALCIINKQQNVGWHIQKHYSQPLFKIEKQAFYAQILHYNLVDGGIKTSHTTTIL